MASEHLRNTNRSHLREPLYYRVLHYGLASYAEKAMLLILDGIKVSTTPINSNERQCRYLIVARKILE
jgi:hypothetical protein